MSTSHTVSDSRKKFEANGFWYPRTTSFYPTDAKRYFTQNYDSHGVCSIYFALGIKSFVFFISYFFECHEQEPTEAKTSGGKNLVKKKSEQLEFLKSCPRKIDVLFYQLENERGSLCLNTFKLMMNYWRLLYFKIYRPGCCRRRHTSIPYLTIHTAGWPIFLFTLQ
jgi:hypothetical protein